MLQIINYVFICMCPPTMCGYLPYAKSSFLEASLIMLAQFLY